MLDAFKLEAVNVGVLVDDRRALLAGGVPCKLRHLGARANLHTRALKRLAAADAFRSLGLNRREAAWSAGRLRQGQMALFAAANQREGVSLPEIDEPPVPLDLMTLGSDVVADYRSVGLTLRPHPVSFLRGDLVRQGYLPCAGLGDVPNGRRLAVAGLVLVRQMPGSAKGVMFVTIEDETGVANLIVWPAVFDRFRRTVLSAGMFGIKGRLQRASEVTHVVVEEIVDLTPLLRTVGERDEPFALPHGRGDEAKHGGGPDARDALGRRPWDIYIPDLHIRSGIPVKTRDFR